MTSTQHLGDLFSSFTHAQQQLSGIAAIDYFFAKEVCLSQQADNANAAVLAPLCMVLSAYVRAGHTCLAITDIADTCWGSAYDEQGQCTQPGFTFPNEEHLRRILAPFTLAHSASLLVFTQQNVYMRRYYQFETELEGFIQQRLQQKSTFSLDAVRETINTLFPLPLASVASDSKNINQEIDWQKLAVANAINKNFTVIAGGPGTGKTYTVTKLLAALLMLADCHQTTESSPALDIALVAPTGKAAQRLTESINQAIAGFSGLIDAKILAAIPSKAQTIHRLLGVIPNSPNFRHHQDNLLRCDVLLIDEVSMVDLPMMTRIFRALKANTKVILLGDADQLPSVAVGSVLADIAPRPHSGYSAENYHYLAQSCQLDEQVLKNAFPNQSSVHSASDHLSLLMKSRRFDGEGGIGKLATSVIQGDALTSWQLLQNNQSHVKAADAELSLVDSELSTWLAPLVKQYYQGIAQCSKISQAFELLAKFRILCVTRQGEYGVDAINQWVKDYLLRSQNTANNHFLMNEHSYHGMPIMISENDYQLGLFNGDIGLLWHDKTQQTAEQDTSLMAFFEQDNTAHNKLNSKAPISSDYKQLLPSRLPRFDNVYAMTIHKTQGSEFEHVAMILPKTANQLLSRELLYTAITRAKQKLTVASTQPVWQQGVTKQVKRQSGLQLAVSYCR